MLWRVLIIASLLAIIAGGILWIVDGRHIYSKDREPIVEIRTDELFGTTDTVTTGYREERSFGLLPLDATVSDTPRSYAFVLGTSLAVIGFSLYRSRKRRTS